MTPGEGVCSTMGRRIGKKKSASKGKAEKGIRIAGKHVRR